MFFVYTNERTTRGRELIFLASECAIAKSCQLYLGRHAADYAKVNWEKVEAHKRDLESAHSDYFKECGCIRPRSAFARTPGSAQRIQELSSRFAHYNVGTDVKVDARRLQAYLDQFPEHLVPQMLKTLEGIQFLDRTELGRDFATWLRQQASGDNCFVPLPQQLEKSATHLSYLLDDFPAGFATDVLRDALNKEGEILFFDDCLLSGSQARTIVQIWFGLDPDLDERPAEVLTTEEQAKLRARTARFRFLSGTRNGLKNLRELTSQVGLSTDIEALRILDQDTPLLTEILGDAATDLRAFLQDVGQSLLLSTKGEENPDKWTPERCEQFALGYGGMEQLLVFFYNTPTATITPFWKSGIYRGLKWIPLFPRRKEESPSLPPPL